MPSHLLFQLIILGGQCFLSSILVSPPAEIWYIYNPPSRQCSLFFSLLNADDGSIPPPLVIILENPADRDPSKSFPLP